MKKSAKKQARSQFNGPMIQVGGIDPEAMPAYRDLVLAILAAAAGDAVKIAALSACQDLGSVKQASITGCTLTMGDK